MKQEIEKRLKTKWLGRNLYFYKSIDSTQKEIYRLIEKYKKIQNGTVIIAQEQTDGIGTHGRKWYTGKNKNISFSFVVYPNCPINKIDGFTVKIAECLMNTIKEKTGILLEIKEPNDLIYKGKKVAGILTTSNSIKENVKQIIIGIGVNVNEIYFPEEITNISTSLKIIKDKEIEREDIIACFLNNFEILYEKYI